MKTKTFAVVLAAILLFAACGNKESAPPKEYEPIPLPETSAADALEKDYATMVFTLDTIEEHPQAQEVRLAAVLRADLPNNAQWLKKLMTRGMNNPGNHPQAKFILEYAWEVYQQEHPDAKFESVVLENNTKATAIPTDDCKKMLQAAFNNQRMADWVTNSLLETKVYDSGRKAFLVGSPSADTLGEFMVTVMDKDIKRTIVLSPMVDKPIQSITLSYHKGTDEIYRLENIAVEQDMPKNEIEFSGAYRLSDKLTDSPYYDLQIVGSIDGKPIAVDYWDRVLTVFSLDPGTFAETKRNSFEFGEPQIDFRDSRMFLRFPKHVAVLDQNLTALFFQPIPQFMQDYQNKYPNKKYEGNTARDLEFYDYDLSGDYQTYLYASGQGMYLYFPSTQKQRSLLESTVNGQSLDTAFRVRFLQDDEQAFGQMGSGQYLQYYIESRTPIALNSGEVSALALSPQYADSGSFFQKAIPGLITVGKNHYVAKAPDGKGVIVGLLSNPDATVSYTVPEELDFSALLDDGRMVFTTKSREYPATFCTTTPGLTAPPAVPEQPVSTLTELPVAEGEVLPQ